MVIQRWQTVWLLVAAVLVALFCFVPMAVVPGAAAGETSLLMPKDLPVILIVNCVTVVLLVLSILMFKNTARQKMLALVSMLLIAVTALTETGVLYCWDTTNGNVEWMGSIFLLVGAFCFTFLAHKAIRHDERLLRAADRLR